MIEARDGEPNRLELQGKKSVQKRNGAITENENETNRNNEEVIINKGPDVVIYYPLHYKCFADTTMLLI